MSRGRFDEYEDEDRAPEAEYFADQRRFMRMIYFSIATVIVLCVGAFGVLVNRFDPCSGIDWMADYTAMTELDPQRIDPYWPTQTDFEAMKTASLQQVSSSNREFEDLALKGIQNNCLLLDWSAMGEGDEVTKNNFVKAIIQPPTSERLDDIALTGETRRVAVRSSLFARECRIAGQTPKEPSGVVLVKELDAIYPKEQLVLSSRSQFDKSSVIDTNSDIYLISLLSPRNYFESSDTLRFLTKVGGVSYLYNLYFDNTQENVKNYDRGTVVYTEIINLASVRKKIERARDRCTAGGGRPESGATIPVL